MDAGSRIERLSPHYERGVLPLHNPAIKLLIFHSLKAQYCKCLLSTYIIHLLTSMCCLLSSTTHLVSYYGGDSEKVALGSSPSLTESLFLKNYHHYTDIYPTVKIKVNYSIQIFHERFGTLFLIFSAMCLATRSSAHCAS